MSHDDEIQPVRPIAKGHGDPVNDAFRTSDQVQESAHALIQLAHGSAGQADSTGNDVSSTADKHPKSLLTSQEILEAAAAQRVEARRTKGQKRKQARAAGKAEAARAIATLTNDEGPSNTQSHNAPHIERLVSVEKDLHGPPLSGSPHPLDEVSTDEETRNIVGLTEDPDNSISLPRYTPSQRREAIRKTPSKQNPRPRKRRKLSLKAKTTVNQREGDHNRSLSAEDPVRREDATTTVEDSGKLGHFSPVLAGTQTALSPRGSELFIDPSLETRPVEHEVHPRNSSRNVQNTEPLEKIPNDTINKRTRRSARRVDHVTQQKDYISPYTHTFQLAEDRPFVDPEGPPEEQAYNGFTNLDARADSESDAVTHQKKFGEAELRKIARFRDAWCQRNARQPHQFNELVQANLRANRGAAELFRELQEIFPNHRSIYIQRFCRRKFHNYRARGTWTPVEDEQLCRAVAEKGTAWKYVGEMIHRFPEDCRDRWRNYLATPEKRNYDVWTDAETQALAHCIYDCFCERFRNRWEQETDMSGYFPPPDPEIGPEDLDMKLINWETVSDRMLGLQLRRTRLQCSYKWSKIEATEQMRLLQVAQDRRDNNYDGFIDQDENHTKGGSSWRAQQASKTAQRMLAGDKMDLLQALAECGARSEEAISWKALGPDWFQERWTTAERKAAWLALKGSLESDQSDDYRRVVDRLLEQFSGSQVDERWDPEQEQPVTKRSYRKRMTRTEVVNKITGVNDTISTIQTAEDRQAQQQTPREVIEIASDDGFDEYRPHDNGAHSAELDGNPYPPHHGPTERRTRSQAAAMIVTAPLFEPNHEANMVDMSFEIQPMATTPQTEGDISPQLQRRLLALQHA